MSCQQVPTTPAFNPYPRSVQVGEFEVAIGGGIWVAIRVATDHALLNVGGAMLFGATFVGIVSLTLTLIGRCFPANPAKAMARMTLSYGVAQIIAPAMAGYIATASGSYHGALVVTALVMGCGVVALQALIHEEKRAAHQAAGAR